jgi:hypothetical protein
MPRLAVRIAVLALAAGLAACGSTDKAEKKKGELSQATADIAHDTALLQGAESAANRVIHNAQDCDAARAALVETNRVLDEAKGKVRSIAGQVTLDALRTQVKNIATSCGA